MQFSPTELEEILQEMDGIADAAVIGVPDKKNGGELAKAFVVKRPKSKISKSHVKRYLEPLVAHYKHLKGGVKFVDHIPKDAAGKIMRAQLREMDSSRKV